MIGRRSVAAAVAGLLVGLSLLTWWLSPRVVAWSPSEQEIPAAATLELTFNTPVEADSARQHVVIDPAVPGQIVVEGRRLRFEPEQPLRASETYTVTVRAGVRGRNGLPGLLSTRHRYEVGPPRLLYLHERAGVSNVWQWQVDVGARQLTVLPEGVWSFSPTGNGLLLSVVDRHDGDDLVLWREEADVLSLFDCRGWHCREARWQPGGTLAAYERWPLSEASEEVQVWLLDTENGATWPALEAVPGDLSIGSSWDSHSPRWSADGRYLALYQPETQAIIVLDLQGGEPAMIPANLQAMGGWSPDGHRLAYTELAFGPRAAHTHVDEEGEIIRHEGSGLYSHAVITDLSDEVSTDLSAGLEVDDGRPTWGPSGKRVAVSRTLTGSGRQIWLLGRRGDTVALTDNPFVQHTSLDWSPDGRYLAYMRLDMASDGGRPGIWVYDLDAGAEVEVAESGFLPAWRE